MILIMAVMLIVSVSVMMLRLRNRYGSKDIKAMSQEANVPEANLTTKIIKNPSYMLFVCEITDNLWTS